MKKKILCIDDIESNLFTLKSVLETADEYDYEVFTALNAHEGFDILKKERIDIILLDVMMPEVDGFKTAKMLSANKRTKDIPIIFVTAKTDDITIEKCYEVGGSDYTTKPLNSIELLNRIVFHIKLREKERLLSKEKEYVQSVFDLQDNLIFVTDSTHAINVNKAVLEFFNLKNIFEFQKKFSCICEAFIKEEGYFHLDLVEDDDFWVEDIIKNIQNKDFIVKIINKSGDYHIFAIKAAKFYDMYIVSLTDITTISEQSKEFEREANFDRLTQIYNRNMFHRVLDKKIIESKILNSSFTFVILDIDHFKNVNDTYGHLVGDEILKSLSSLIEKNTRANDIFARWGGEEFVLVLNAELQKGAEIVEYLRKLIDEIEFAEVGNLTCSFGITDFKNDDNIDSMTKRADEALYEAKDTGRNKICIKS